jgi:uncharacterized protein (TIGR03083 family)
MAVGTESPISQLDRALAAVGELISNIRPERWSASTPCADWTVRQIVNHLNGQVGSTRNARRAAIDQASIAAAGV